MNRRMKRPLREGFTTGTAAAAAAAAAVAVLFGEPSASVVTIPLPPFTRVDGRVEWACNARLDVPVCRSIPSVRAASPSSARAASASVIKDGGDDPDATHGMTIIVHASFRPFSQDVEAAFSGAVSEDLPPLSSPPLLAPGFPNPVFLYAGRGIGRVTLPGLPVPPGEAAINPQPRRQIAASACEAANRHGYSGPLYLYIAVPEGVERAAHTLNARLGIVGGISILGTSGIVRPYSHEAWRAAIEQGMSVSAAAGVHTLLLSTGRRSERALFRLYPELPAVAGVQAADFASFSLRRAVCGPFSRVAWGCFPGKLLKLAQGLEWTHAKTAPADIPLLGRLWLEHGGSEGTAQAISAMPTAVGAFALMREDSSAAHDAVLRALAERAAAVMLGWMREERELCEKAGPLPEVFLHIFTLEGEVLLSYPVHAKE